MHRLLCLLIFSVTISFLINLRTALAQSPEEQIVESFYIGVGITSLSGRPVIFESSSMNSHGENKWSLLGPAVSLAKSFVLNQSFATLSTLELGLLSDSNEMSDLSINRETKSFHIKYSQSLLFRNWTAIVDSAVMHPFVSLGICQDQIVEKYSSVDSSPEAKINLTSGVFELGLFLVSPASRYFSRINVGYQHSLAGSSKGNNLTAPLILSSSPSFSGLTAGLSFGGGF